MKNNFIIILISLNVFCTAQNRNTKITLLTQNVKFDSGYISFTDDKVSPSLLTKQCTTVSYDQCRIPITFLKTLKT